MHAPDIICFSYLAAVSTLYVDEYPLPDGGSQVSAVERFLAGDGPIVAGAASALGLRADLLSNSVGPDENGAYLEDRLAAWGVRRLEPTTSARSITPNSTVVCDRAGTRTYFPYLPDVEHELGEVGLAGLATARVLYVDCYAVIERAARRAITEALSIDLPIVVNLGGSHLPKWLVEAAAGRRLKAIQTNVPDGDEKQMRQRAAALAKAELADIVLVTAGRSGALAQVGHDAFSAPARMVRVQQVQGAGALFSAGFISANMLAMPTSQRRSASPLRLALCGASERPRMTGRGCPTYRTHSMAWGNDPVRGHSRSATRTLRDFRARGGDRVLGDRGSRSQSRASHGVVERKRPA